MTSRLLPALLALVVLLLATTVRSAPAHAAPELLVSYRGELIDGDMKAISGVFPLTLKFMQGDKATEARWSEKHWVAVAEGQYTLILGRKNAIPRALENKDVTIVVELGAAGEIARHSLRVAPWVEPRPAVDPEHRHLTLADISEKALFAEEARTAQDCQTLGGKTAAELDQFDAIMKRIDESGRGGIRISTKTTALEPVGGPGGQPYMRICPPGHLVVGIKGKAGELLDSFEVVCAPIE